MISVTRRFGAGATLVALALVAGACGSSSKKSTATTTASTAVATTAVATTAASGATTSAAGTAATATTATTAASGATVAPTTSAAATGSSGSTATTGSAGTTVGTSAGGGVTTAGISAAECAANKAVGKITYISSFDFSASASIVDVVVAKEKGYFDKMCLDVDLKPGFSTTNYPIVASGQAQFSSAGNFTEILNNSTSGASFVAVVDYGKAPIEALVTKDPTITDLTQLKGKTIGVKGDIPPSIVAMLANAGLIRGTDYHEVLLDGFDPVAQLQQQIDALPVYKSNEPRALDAAGVKYALFDPAKMNVPGTFGLIYTSKDFATKNPTATADFTRAALHGMEDAIADPAGAVALSIAQINAAGNQNFLTQEGETFRWNAELAVVKASTPAGEPVGLIDPAIFDNEYKTYVKDGVFPKGAPPYTQSFDPNLAKSLYDSSGKVIWPAS
jgi:ABC-type nitrate/sulfonate/bicarbonate transport system substrate-binding protein